MQTTRSNPFHKPNPFKFGHYEHFHHPQLPTSTPNNLTHLVYSSQHQRPKVLNNSWVFNQKNIDRKVDFSRKYQPGASKVSDFEVKMRVSSIYVPPNDRSRITPSREGPLQNPFLRKNLLVNQEEVKNQVQMDLSLYRQKAYSNYDVPKRMSIREPMESRTYHQNQGRMSFGTLPNDNSGNRENRSSSNPYDHPLVVSQYMGEPLNNESLVYSRTPIETKRNPQEDAPTSIVFHAKRFFLTPVIEEG